MHGAELARAGREARRRRWRFEAAVAGGIPIIKALREGLAGNRDPARLRHPQRHLQLHPDHDARDRPRVRRRAGRGAAAGLRRGRSELRRRRHRRRAQAGDADRRSPSAPGRFRRACISRASATSPPWTSQFAEELGYRIKLLGLARETRARHRAARASLHGAARPRRSRRSRACSTPWWSRATSSARRCSQGRGAGAGPTASAVVADLVDIARGRDDAGLRRAGRPAAPTSRSRRWQRTQGGYYMRLMVLDRPGVIADVSARLRDQRVSLESMLQRGRRSRARCRSC